MRLIWQTIRRYRRTLIGALVLATINQVFSLLDPQIFRIIVDRYASHPGLLGQGASMRGVLLLVVALIGVALISRIAKNFQDYFVNVISQRVSTHLYARSVEHAFSLPYASFEDQRSGELLQKMQKARADIQAVITSAINTVFLSVVGIIFVLVYSYIVHWSIGLAYTVALPTIGIVTFIISRRIKIAQRTIVRETADLAGSTTETLRNVELVKSLGLEDQEIGRLNEVNERILGLELKKVRLIRTLSFIQGTMLNSLRSALILLMLWLILTGHISLGQFFSIFIYSFFIFSPLAELGTVFAQYQEARASTEQLQRILATPSAPKPTSPVAIGTLDDIAFNDASFIYGSAAIPSVEHIALHIRAGETVAFVGPSGAGKTTLVKLILGLYQPTAGSLTLNGIDAGSIDFGTLRQRIGLVTQETQLFAGTIRDNLLFVNPGASEAACLEVMDQASALPIIERGGQGLDTKIGEGGVKISGGERQRLAIARALLRKPDLLVFDEATSSLDSLTEKEITGTMRNISRDKPGRITVLVAHRLSTVAHADRIYVLEHGRLIEQGSHAGLLASGGLYAALWREQSGILRLEGLSQVWYTRVTDMPWYFYALASALLVTVLSLVEKRLLFRVHSMDYSAALAFVNALCALPLLFFVDLSKVDPYPVIFLGFATILSVPAFLLTTKGVRHLEISTVEPFLALGPGISALLALIVLNEKLAPHQALGIAFAVAGMYVLETKPHVSLGESFRPLFRSRYVRYTFYALGIYAVTSLIDRVILSRYDMEPIAYIIFVQIFIAFHFFVISLLTGDGSTAIWRGISKARWMILLAAILTTLARIMQMTAVKAAPLGLVLTVKRTSVLFVTLIGGELFHEKNILRKTIAALIIVAGSLLIVL